MPKSAEIQFAQSFKKFYGGFGTGIFYILVTNQTQKWWKKQQQFLTGGYSEKYHNMTHDLFDFSFGRIWLTETTNGIVEL